MQSLDRVRGPVLDVTETIRPISRLNTTLSEIATNSGKIRLNRGNLGHEAKIYAEKDR